MMLNGFLWLLLLATPPNVRGGRSFNCCYRWQHCVLQASPCSWVWAVCCWASCIIINMLIWISLSAKISTRHVNICEFFHKGVASCLLCDLHFLLHNLHHCFFFFYAQHLHCHLQALDTGEAGHSIEYATKRETKPLNRFANIVVCKLVYIM